MNKINFVVVTLFSLLILVSPSSTADNDYWQRASDKQTVGNSIFFEYILDEELILSKAKRDKQISIPLTDGSFVTFNIESSKVLPPALQAKFPNIHSFSGESPSDSTLSGRFDFSHKGFKAMIYKANGEEHIRIFKQENDIYKVIEGMEHNHNNRQMLEPIIIPEEKAGRSAAQNNVSPSYQDSIELAATGIQTQYNFRIAIATTGEFTQYFGGTVADSMAEITSIVNRMNQIFLTDLGVQFTLVDDNDDIIYTDGSTDPYTNSDLSASLSENQANLDSVIGNTNYDLGHVLGSAGGGVAGLGTLCRNMYKAYGYSGINNGNAVSEGDFWINIIAHEIGHQFGATHIYNATAGVCTTRTASSAYEIGSGSTIMSYSGLCSVLNTVSTSSPYYNQYSLEQMRNKLATIPAACGTATVSSNNLPVANAGSDFTIPANTFFELVGSATDANASDSLTYTWEQEDLGDTELTVSDVNTDEGDGPLFKSISPSSSPKRTLPAITNIEAGDTVFGETLPTTSRDINFTFTVRDGAGGTDSDEMVVTSVSNSGGFSMSAPASGDSITSNPVTFSWDVAGTTASPISCAEVTILMSNDDGDTFIEIDKGIANDGSYSTDLPLSDSELTGLMLRLKCSDNIFFAQHSGEVSTDLSATGTSYLITAQQSLSIPVGQNSITVTTSNFTVSGLTPTALILLDGESYRVSGDDIIVEPNYNGNLEVALRATDGTNKTAYYLATINVGGTPADDSSDDSDDPVDDSDDADDTPQDTPEASDFLVVENSTDNNLDILSVYSGSTDGVTIISATHSINGGTPSSDRISIASDGLSITFRPATNSTEIETISATLSNNDVVVALVAPLPESGQILNMAYDSVNEDSQYAFELDDFVSTLQLVGLLIEPGVNYTVDDNLLIPDPDFSGLLQVSFRITDGYTFTEAFTITDFVVTNVNDSPVINPDSPIIYQNSANNVIDILANDFDADAEDELTITQALATNNGTVSINNNELIYTPDNSFFGTERISYSVSDGLATVRGVLEFDVIPVIFQRSLVTPVDTDFTFQAVDFALNFQVSSITVGAGSNYTVSGTTITPDAGFAGTLAVPITITGPNPGESTVYNAIVTVGTLNNNTPPVIFSDSFLVNQNSTNNVLNPLANDTDADANDTLIITQVSSNSDAVITFTNNNVIFTPEPGMTGIETITYTVSDGAATDQGTVTITVAQTIFHDAFVTDTAQPLLFTPNDFGLAFPVQMVTLLPGENYTVINNQLVVNLAFEGTLNVALQLTGATQTINYVTQVLVDTGNDAPTTVSDVLAVFEDSNSSTVNVLGNDSDLDNDVLTLVSAQGDQGAIVTVVNNELSYQPVPDFAGTEIVTYIVADPDGASSTGTLTVTVTGLPDLPMAVADTFRANINQSNFIIDVLANDTHPDGDTLSIVEASTSGAGQVNVINNQISYTPARDFTGEEIVTYVITDGRNEVEGTLTINVEDSTVLNNGNSVNSQGGSLNWLFLSGLLLIMLFRRQTQRFD